MAKQVGIIRLSGTIGGINFYKSYARKAGGGFNGKAILTDSKFVRVRENASEFGRVSQVKRSLRNALSPFLSISKDGSLHGRMMSMLMGVAHQDKENIRGERRISAGLRTNKGKYLFDHFVYTPNCIVSEVLGIDLSYDFTDGIFKTPALQSDSIRFPKASTHLALTFGLLHFDFDSRAYELKTAHPIYLERDQDFEGINVTIPAPSLSGCAMALIGLKSYQKIGENYYLLREAQGTGLEILGVKNQE